MNIVLLLSALLLTTAIEWIVLRVMGEESRKILLYSMLINAATNLPLNIFVAQAAIANTGVKRILQS